RNHRLPGAAPMIAALYVLAQAMPLDPGRHSILHPGAPQGSHIEWLYWVIFWIVFAVYVLMILGFTRAGVKSRSDAIYPLPVFEDKEGDERAKWAVGTAVAVTVVTLFGVLVQNRAAGNLPRTMRGVLRAAACAYGLFGDRAVGGRFSIVGTAATEAGRGTEQ